MKKLVLHPEDISTAFLKPIYDERHDVTVVTGGIGRKELMEKVKVAEQVILLGHGTPDGLLSVGQFPGAGMYVVDDSYAPLIAEKKNTLFIWCFADQFVQRNKLNGCGTGMFVSEPPEALLCGLGETQIAAIEESNETFARTVGKFLDAEPEVLYAAMRHEMGKLALSNPVAAYNHSRLFFSQTRKMTG